VAADTLSALAKLIRTERQALLADWRAQVRQLPSAQGLDIPTLNDHVPALIDELAAALAERSEGSIVDNLVDGTPPDHGRQRLRDGFDIAEVVAEYNILRGSLHDLARTHGLLIEGQAFHIVNRILDAAIGLAVQTYATERGLEIQKRREQYVAFVAHDLRTPLNAISLAAKVLEKILPEEARSGPSAQMLNALHRNVGHLETLVENVIKENTNIQAAAAITVERRALDLWPLIEALIFDLNPVAATASTRLLNEVPEDMVVHADASLLRRVFQNLLANAIKYTPRGEVCVGARKLGEDGTVECWVLDNGAGIPAERLGKIFEESETDDEGGYGLGLAIVKQYVEAHGGSVDVESRDGSGSKFRFTLPGAKSPSR
jgi:signal transduction histidine kinase